MVYKDSCEGLEVEEVRSLVVLNWSCEGLDIVDFGEMRVETGSREIRVEMSSTVIQMEAGR